ncbi:MAG: gliding motility-associated C-terminal domain-containing protein [Flavobacteriales bacterium]|nr:gliding motility-associated C-terminal domain-containing protein [Flavobacteriales bacterium]
MRKISNRLSPKLFLILTLCFLCGGLNELQAQLNVVPSTSCPSCDGSATFNSSLSSDVYWVDSQGGILQTESGVTSSVLNGLCPGAYALIEVNSNDSIVQWFSIQSLLTPLPDAVQADMCEGEDPEPLEVLLGALPAGTWLDPSGTTFDGNYDPDFMDSGFYTYSVDEGGCPVSTGVMVTEWVPANAGLGTTYLICETYSQFFLTDFMSGNPDYGGTWYNSIFQEVTGFYNPATMESELFTYIIDSVPGCPAEVSTMYVIENHLLDPGDDTEIQVCPNALPFNMTSVLNGNPNLGGNWYDDSFDPIAGIFDPVNMPPGEYTYLVPGDSPCPSLQSSLTVTFTQGIDAGSDGAVEVCSNSPILNLQDVLNGTPTDGGVWTNSSGQVVDGSFNPSIDAEDTFTYTVSAVGCQPLSAEVEVVLEVLLEAGPNQNLTVCENNLAIDLNDWLSGQSDGGGVWTNISNQVISSDVTLQVGTTTYYYYNQTGDVCPNDVAQYGMTGVAMPPSGEPVDMALCESDAPVELTEFLPDQGAFDASFTDSDGNAASTAFDPGSSTPDAFTWTIYSGNVCPDVQIPVSVSLEYLAFEDLVLDIELCSSEESVVLDLAFDELAGLNGIWYDSNFDVVDPVMTIGDLGDTTLNLLYLVDNGSVCPPSLANAGITVVEQVDLGENQWLDLCFNAGTIDLNDVLNGNYSNGVWYFQGVETSPQFNTGTNAPGVYTYEVPASGPCAPVSAEVLVDVDSGIPVFAGVDTAFCVSSSPVALGGAAAPGYSYTWTGSEYLSSQSVANPVFVYTGAEDSFVNQQIVVTADNGICQITDTVQIEVWPLPQIDLGPDLALCQNEILDMDLTGQATDFNWMPTSWFADPSASAQSLQLVNSGEVAVTAWNEYGCQSDDQMHVEVLPLPDAAFSADPIEGCAPLSVQLFNTSENDSPEVSYVWIFEDGSIIEEFDPSFVFTEEGLHDVTLIATSANGCVNTLEAQSYIEVHPSPWAFWESDLSDQTVLDPIVYFTNHSLGATGYLWDFGFGITSYEEDPIIEFPETPGVSYPVCLTAINEFGCIDTLCREVFIAGEMWIYAPNAFTPDEDGINDVFLPVLRGFDPDFYTFSIYSRWGQLVFQTHDPQMPWVGEFRGGNHYVQNDVYIWKIEAKDAYTADFREFTGHVSIVR